MPNDIDEPVVPVPAPAEISPVGFSSTVILMIFDLIVDPSLISVLTWSNIFFDLI